jgi:hypothetical protein
MQTQHQYIITSCAFIAGCTNVRGIDPEAKDSGLNRAVARVGPGCDDSWSSVYPFGMELRRTVCRLFGDTKDVASQVLAVFSGIHRMAARLMSWAMQAAAAGPGAQVHTVDPQQLIDKFVDPVQTALRARLFAGIGSHASSASDTGVIWIAKTAAATCHAAQMPKLPDKAAGAAFQAQPRNVSAALLQDSHVAVLCTELVRIAHATGGLDLDALFATMAPPATSPPHLQPKRALPADFITPPQAASSSAPIMRPDASTKRRIILLPDSGIPPLQRAYTN